MHFAKKNIKILMLSLMMLTLFAGCIRAPQSISSKYEILPEKPDGFAISKRVLLVADNQLNNLYGEPIWLRNQLFDHIVSVTIRPVQQDLFGQDILKWVLQYYGKRIPVVHLGDGANMACVGEFKAFREIMNTARRPWVMAPGNHDAYLLGNLHNGKTNWWENACKRSQGPMTKDRMVMHYLRHLKEQHPDFGQYLNDHPESGEWRSPNIEKTFLKAVAWKIDREKPYRSYVLQELDLSMPRSDLKVSAILMDSTQFEKAPNLIPAPPLSYNAGVTGSMLPDQMSLAEQWLKNKKTDQNPTIIMAHHPYATLKKDARRVIDGFRKKYSVPLYISGHTHHGEYLVRGGDEGWIELNVGSIVDWPIEFRTFEIHEIKNDPSNLVFRTPLFRIPDMWDNAVPPRKPQCKTDWEIKNTDAKDFYLAHNYKSSPDPQKSQKAILTALLHTYKNLITAVASADDNPTWPAGLGHDHDILTAIDRALTHGNNDEMTTLLIQLGEFEKNRKTKSPLIQRDYRLCQAVWASKYDQLKGRLPVISDPYIRFPKGD